MTTQASTQTPAPAPASAVRVGVGCFVTKRAHGETFFLLGQRKGSHGSGAWALPGGHLEMCESWDTCARREVLEECNVELPPDLAHVATTNNVFRDSVPIKHYITLVMAPRDPAAAFGGSVRLMEPDKCAQWIWVTWSELVRREAAVCRDACADSSSDSAPSGPMSLEPLFLPLQSLIAQTGSKSPLDF
ncbi:hypothetical protein H4217_000517 [Coemansia sp. RSA 1939]|nr:hypothetical protein H4217_000517 [Coemansia sp. RSA 1939]KAJ2617546.1 hypothetical protein EV177_000509 [Coemansia sp. RSA 1804]KAJ2693967.1 hypothetical protein GGH99_000901 [Coemansia sp. RSA 1285]